MMKIIISTPGINGRRFFAKFFKFSGTSGAMKNSGNLHQFAGLVVALTGGAKEISAIVRVPISFFNQRAAKLCILLCLVSTIQCFNAVAGNAESPSDTQTATQSGNIRLPVSDDVMAVKISNQFWWFLTGLCNGIVFSCLYYNRKISKSKVTAKRPVP